MVLGILILSKTANSSPSFNLKYLRISGTEISMSPTERDNSAAQSTIAIKTKMVLGNLILSKTANSSPSFNLKYLRISGTEISMSPTERDNSAAQSTIAIKTKMVTNQVTNLLSFKNINRLIIKVFGNKSHGLQEGWRGGRTSQIRINNKYLIIFDGIKLVETFPNLLFFFPNNSHGNDKNIIRISGNHSLSRKCSPCQVFRNVGGIGKQDVIIHKGTRNHSI